jgi:hypothetical protein
MPMHASRSNHSKASNSNEYVGGAYDQAMQINANSNTLLGNIKNQNPSTETFRSINNLLQNYV